MFTGIVKEIGILQRKEKRLLNSAIALTIQSREVIKELAKGSSVSVNGVCLTVEDIFKEAFGVELMEETIIRTNLASLRIPAKLNLEPALNFGDELGGNLMTGHIDGLGRVIKKGDMQGGVLLEIQFPPALKKFLTFKGAITVNGVSLTIIDVTENTFKVGLIPYTQKNTNLGDIKETDLVNLEADLIARYLDTLYENRNRGVGLQ